MHTYYHIVAYRLSYGLDAIIKTYSFSLLTWCIPTP